MAKRVEWMRGPWGWPAGARTSAEPFRVLFDGNPCPRLHHAARSTTAAGIQDPTATAAAGESRGTGGQRIFPGKSDRFWDLLHAPKLYNDDSTVLF
jgi:hypothetical protein